MVVIYLTLESNVLSVSLNKLFNFFYFRTDEVCFLDCDVGQSELMPSGSICLHRLTEPLLGELVHLSS